MLDEVDVEIDGAVEDHEQVGEVRDGLQPVGPGHVHTLKKRMRSIWIG